MLMSLAFWTVDLGLDKHHRCVNRVWHLVHNVAAGAYPGWLAYDSGLAVYRDVCHAEGDWKPDNDRKYKHMWASAIGKITTDPGQIAAVEDKRERMFGGRGALQDPVGSRQRSRRRGNGGGHRTPHGGLWLYTEGYSRHPRTPPAEILAILGSYNAGAQDV